MVVAPAVADAADVVVVAAPTAAVIFPDVLIIETKTSVHGIALVMFKLKNRAFTKRRLTRAPVSDSFPPIETLFRIKHT